MLLDALPHTCTARRRVRTKDSMVGSIDDFSTVVFVNKECWRQPASDSDVFRWQQRDLRITHKVFFSEEPVGLDEGCVLEFDDGWRLDVQSHADPDDSVGLGVLWRVMTQRVGVDDAS